MLCHFSQAIMAMYGGERPHLYLTKALFSKEFGAPRGRPILRSTRSPSSACRFRLHRLGSHPLRHHIQHRRFRLFHHQYRLPRPFLVWPLDWHRTRGLLRQFRSSVLHPHAVPMQNSGTEQSPRRTERFMVRVHILQRAFRSRSDPKRTALWQAYRIRPRQC